MENIKFNKIYIGIIIIYLYLMMLFFQQFLDKNSRISLHCYIRNISIIFTICYLCKYKWLWIIFFMPFIIELIIAF